jgi:hypothetical protein
MILNLKPKLRDRRKTERRITAAPTGERRSPDKIVVLLPPRLRRISHWPLPVGLWIGGPYSECFPYSPFSYSR